MGLTLKKLTASIGAEVSGINMADVDDETLAEIRAAWIEHKVLVLRDQDISIEEHIAFGRRFGELEVHPFAYKRDGYPEIVRIHSTPDKPYAASRWHSDVTWRAEPSMGSILRGLIIPPAGGDTCFANAAAAYDRLEDGWKARIDGLVAVHDFVRVFGDRLSDAERAEKREEYPVQSHPVVRTHPETGDRCIYTNKPFVSHIEGLSEAESNEILAHLETAIASPSVQCRVRWEVDTFVMWDNRSTQHNATNDYWPEERMVERVTVAGDRPS